MFKSSFLINRNELQATELGMRGKIKSNDGVDLAYISYVPLHPQCIIIFYHGGGANNLDYTFMAQSLHDTSRIATFLFDIRGHGQSGGPRGYSPSKELVWSDISNAIRFMKKKFPNTPIYLGGHSSGAGLVLNYSSWNKREVIKGYLMIAPEFGYRIAQQKIPFAKVNKFAFIINKVSKGYFCNKMLAVRFNYSTEQINNWGFLRGYTVNMADAVTPDDPVNALINIREPLYIYIADEDELIDNVKLNDFLNLIIKKNPLITIEYIPHAKHIMILKDVHEYIRRNNIS